MMLNWDILPCGVYAIDKNGKIIMWNEAMSRFTGFDREHMIGRDAAAVQFHGTDSRESPFNPFHCVEDGSAPFLSRTVYIMDSEKKLKPGFVQARHLNNPEYSEASILIALADISQEISCELLESSKKDRTPDRFHGIVGKSSSTQEVFRLIGLASESMANVLVTGESGTGKELVARAIHFNSSRRNHPFVTVNCSALAETLLESELFGHVKGAFTGAYRDKTGKIESANGGTIFLDEIGDISPLIQLKLLRVIQEKTIEKVGDNRRINVDMRIVAATNRNLRRLVVEGTFREDFYYRLKVFPIHLIPLRERKNDITLLCRHFVEEFNRKTGKSVRGLAADASRLIMDYCWPGNIRELENCIEYAFVLAQGNQIEVFDLPQDIRTTALRDEICRDRVVPFSAAGPSPNDPGSNGNGLNEQPPSGPFEAAANPGPLSEAQTGKAGRAGNGKRRPISRDELLELLRRNGWNKSETARQLDISRVALWKKLKKLGIASPADTRR